MTQDAHCCCAMCSLASCGPPQHCTARCSGPLPFPAITYCAVACCTVLQEDDLLRSMVDAQGPANWPEIADRLPGRTSKSCRLRWVVGNGGEGFAAARGTAIAAVLLLLH